MFIVHRVNSSDYANSISSEYGIEFDIRDSNNKIIVSHDPFNEGQEFEDFISKISKRFLIVNVKSEGIENQAIEILEKYGFEDFFLLDCSFPSIIKLSKNNERRIALRFSEYENFAHIIDNKDKASWIWVDCFSYFPLTKVLEEVFHAHGFKICIVSPELQNQNEKIKTYKEYIRENKILVDAICTKEYNIEKWL